MSGRAGTESVGELLRRYRFRVGLTQAMLAHRAGVSERSVRDLEQGRVTRPQASSVQRLAAALELAEVERTALVEAATPADGGPAARPVGKATVAVPDERGRADPPTARLRIDVLGPLAVRHGGTGHTITSSLLRSLLGLLAIHPGQVVTTADIVDVLWGDDPPRTWRELVHTYVGQLRRLLEPGRSAGARTVLLPRVHGGYHLDLTAGQLDLYEYEELVAQARAARHDGDPQAARTHYHHAWSLWRGPLLADATHLLRSHPTAVAITRRRLAAVLEHADLAIADGHCTEVLEPLQRLAADDPLNEGLAARLLLAYAGCGQQVVALRLFTAIRTRLASELGVTPGAELRAAHLKVLRGEVGAAAPAPPVAPAASTAPPARPVPAQLPADVPGFTGREPDLAYLDRNQQAGITAITGMGGIGKTALAVHWARRSCDRFPDGQLYVNLGGHSGGRPTHPITALNGFLHALGAPPEQVPAELAAATAMYRSLLAGRQVLILLDNAANADQVRPLLPGDPRSRVLITSRDRLTGLIAREGADAVTVTGLDPSEARDLLTRMLGADRIAAEPQAAADLAGVCAYLPLAVRIAAANLAIGAGSSIAEYVTRLRTGNRLAALAIAGDPTTAVRATFEESYAAADPAERRLFRRLGLLPGPDITAAAAAALSGQEQVQVEVVLGRLSARHLITEHLPGRYALHDLLRLYATELATADDDPADRGNALAGLGAHYLRGARAAADLLYPHLLRLPQESGRGGPAAGPAVGGSPTGAGQWLDAERANLVAMVCRLGQDHLPDAWRLADALYGFFWRRAIYPDWETVATVALACAQRAGDQQAEAGVELSLGGLDERRSRYEAAHEHYRRAHDLAERSRWPECAAVALNNLAQFHWVRGQLPETVDHLNRALAAHQRTGRRAGVAVTLANLGAAHLELARDPAGAAHADLAREYLNRALALHREIGDRCNESDTIRVLALVELAAGHPEAAEGLAADAVALARDAADVRMEALTINTLATVHGHLGLDGAVELHDRALAIADDIDDPTLSALVLTDQAGTHLRRGDRERARATGQRALAIAREINAHVVVRRTLKLLGGILSG